jgi:hypothetical protein
MGLAFDGANVCATQFSAGAFGKPLTKTHEQSRGEAGGRILSQDAPPYALATVVKSFQNIVYMLRRRY